MYKKKLWHEEPVDYLCDGQNGDGVTCGTTITLNYNPGENLLLCPACRVKRSERNALALRPATFMFGRCEVITRRGNQCRRQAAGPAYPRCRLHGYEAYAQAVAVA